MKYIQIKGYSAKQLTWTLPKNDNVMKDKNKTNKQKNPARKWLQNKGN